MGTSQNWHGIHLQDHCDQLQEASGSTGWHRWVTSEGLPVGYFSRWVSMGFHPDVPPKSSETSNCYGFEASELSQNSKPSKTCDWLIDLIRARVYFCWWTFHHLLIEILHHSLPQSDGKDLQKAPCLSGLVKANMGVEHIQYPRNSQNRDACYLYTTYILIMHQL